jgi:hypothetical protein
MARGWYGLEVGDEVEYDGKFYTVKKLHISDKNKCTLEGLDGDYIHAVCEWCRKINVPLTPGIYQVFHKGERDVVEVKMTMQGQWPDTKALEMAHFLSGSPRFPTETIALSRAGATFKLVKEYAEEKV